MWQLRFSNDCKPVTAAARSAPARKMPTFAVMISCIATRSADASSLPLPATSASSLACSAAMKSRTRPAGMCASLAEASQQSATKSPTIMPATTDSATELPPGG